MRVTGATFETRLEVMGREQGKCFRCGQTVAYCTGEICNGLPFIRRVADLSIHHRKPRGMGGTRDPEMNSRMNLILLCGSGTTGCHGWVESHRDEAKQQRLLLSQWDDINSAAFSDYRGAWIDLETGLTATR